VVITRDKPETLELTKTTAIELADELKKLNE